MFKTVETLKKQFGITNVTSVGKLGSSEDMIGGIDCEIVINEERKTAQIKPFTNKKLEKIVLTEIQKHSIKCRLEKFEIPQAVAIVPDVWTPDMDLVTAAFKLKRKNIQDHYQLLIDSMYS